MNIQEDPTSSNLAFAMLNSKIRPRPVVGYSVKIFHPIPPNYVTKSPGSGDRLEGSPAYRHQVSNLPENLDQSPSASVCRFHTFYDCPSYSSPQRQPRD